MNKIKLLSTFFIFAAGKLFAQLIDAQPETQTICNGAVASLSANIIPGGSAPGVPGSLPTNSYAISTIPYSPNSYTTGTSISFSGGLSGDDQVSGVLPIGFNFCFFGSTYNQFYAGTNGWISFSAGQPTNFTAVPIPSTAGTVPKNCIMAAWQDWRPGLGSGYPNDIRYTMTGTAPFRKLVVSWNNIPLYSCTSLIGTFQIVIYESTNVIENFIASKPGPCAWEGGTAVQGLHNSTGTAAFTVTGRNSTTWIASNDAVRFTPNGVSGYVIKWYEMPSNTLVGTGSPITVTPPFGNDSTYYYAELTDTSGTCGFGGPSRDTVLVVSDFLSVFVNPDPTICEGQSTMLFASGGVSYSWSPVTGLSDPFSPNPIASPTNTTPYTVMVTSATGCAGMASVTVNVNPSPLVDAGFTAGICSGDNITLGGNGSAGTYSWSPGATLDDSTILTPTASPLVSTNYTLTITNGLGCAASDTVSVMILNPNASAGPDVSICTGTTTQLNATGGDTYLWSPGITLNDSTIANPVASPDSTTTYVVLVTNSSTGCFKNDTITITVAPSAIANAGADQNICIGNTATLGASGGVDFAWVPSLTLNDTSLFNPIANPTVTTTYTVVVTDASGCVDTDSVVVTVNQLPIVNAGNDISVCLGTSASLFSTGAANYVWSPGATLNDSTIANPIASTMVPTTYVVTGTDINGCIDTDTISVTQNILTITSGTNATICAGDSTALTVSGGATYIWSPGSSLSDSTSANTMASPAGSLTYTVVGTGSNGCLDTSYVSINVNPLPAVNAGSSLSVCNGSGANLSVTGANTYIWSPSTFLNNPNIPNPVATPASTTQYIVAGTDLNGCVNYDTITVTVNPVPVANAGSNTSICSGDTISLNASGGGTYTWSPAAGLSNTNISNPLAFPTATTTYSLTVALGTCTSTSQVTITVNTVPVATASADASICNGGSTVLSASGGGTYFWTPSAGLNNSTSPNPTATPGITTQYVVTVSNVAGCTDKDTVIVNVSNSISIGNLIATNETCTNNNGTIVVAGVSGGSNPYSYTINGGPGQNNPAFNNLSQGVYTVTVTDALGCQVSQTANIGVISNVDASFTATPPSGPKPLSVNFSNTSTGATSYFWNFGNGLTSLQTNPSTVYLSNGNYTVTLYAYNGGFPCVDSATFTVEVFEEMTVVVPNVITPNGDGRNDVFVIQSSGVSQLDGTIFNRWGKKVFEWNGSAESGWNGTINGSSAADGTYYYILKLKGMDGTETEQKGYVQVFSN
jgi:gliding motility-associated-like protein